MDNERLEEYYENMLSEDKIGHEVQQQLDDLDFLETEQS